MCARCVSDVCQMCAGPPPPCHTLQFQQLSSQRVYQRFTRNMSSRFRNWSDLFESDAMGLVSWRGWMAGWLARRRTSWPPTWIEAGAGRAPCLAFGWTTRRARSSGTLTGLFLRQIHRRRTHPDYTRRADARARHCTATASEVYREVGSLTPPVYVQNASSAFDHANMGAALARAITTVELLPTQQNC
jgi:hypothetical protein